MPPPVAPGLAGAPELPAPGGPEVEPAPEPGDDTEADRDAPGEPTPELWPGKGGGGSPRAPVWPGRLSPAAVDTLRARLDAALRRPPLRAAQVGVQVVSIDTGRELYARGADTLLNPASNVKLFTSAALLTLLGPGYRFDTEVLSDGAPARGAVRALFVRGRGDPTLVTERLWLLAGDLARKVKLVRGDLVLDDTFFDGERLGPGYDQEEGDRAYLARIDALALNFGAVEIHVGPGERAGAPARVALEPESEHLLLRARVSTSAPGGRARLRYGSGRPGTGASS